MILMSEAMAEIAEPLLAERLQASGIRPTEPRLQIAAVLLSSPQHLSAEQIAEALERRGAHVAKATIYNTLNLFAAHGLIRQLTLDGARTWFDSNVDAHYHFHDVHSGALTDVAVGEVQFARLPTVPEGYELAGVDLVIRLKKADPPA